MALQSFSISNIKAVSYAACEAAPRIMVIAGPNGVGKSTLLYQLAQKRGSVFSRDTTVLYQPPHRAIRASTVRRRNTFGGPSSSYFDLLSRTEVSGFEGLSISMPARTPDNVDEAGSTIKHSFAKLENRFQTAVTERVVREKKASTHLALDQIPDIYGPLRTFTDYLLPHLHFDKIDFSSADDIKCLWSRKDRRAEVSLDIDTLSSGEKSLIIMFLPMIESEISDLLDTIDPPTTPARPTDTLVIIDEPEQHIHPDLQARVMTYLRKVATARDIQFIVSTHSPTILDQAWDDELYVMTAASGDPAENQLKKVATNLERLEVLRDLAGSTFALTTGRSIICVEGRNADPSEPSDIRILELICPRATAYTFVPVGNKASVITTVTQLRANLPAETFKVNVFGITDADRNDVTPPGVRPLPVCMIENLLLQPSALYAAAVALGSEGDNDEGAIVNLLSEITKSMREEEIALRVSKTLRVATIRPRGADRGAVVASIVAALRPYQTLVEAPTLIDSAIDTATVEVDRIIASGRASVEFRGKSIIRLLFNRLFPTGAVSYSRFIHRAAAEVAGLATVQDSLNRLFDELETSAQPVSTG